MAQLPANLSIAGMLMAHCVASNYCSILALLGAEDDHFKLSCQILQSYRLVRTLSKHLDMAASALGDAHGQSPCCVSEWREHHRPLQIFRTVRPHRDGHRVAHGHSVMATP